MLELFRQEEDNIDACHLMKSLDYLLHTVLVLYLATLLVGEQWKELGRFFGMLVEVGVMVTYYVFLVAFPQWSQSEVCQL